MPIILDGTTGITTPGITNTGTFVFQGPVQVPAGSAATASITTAAGANTGIFFPSSSSVAITTAGTQRLVVDASGNAGLGVTPSAWGSDYRAIQVGYGASVQAGNGTYPSYSALAANIYVDNTPAAKYLHSAEATQYSQNGGQHIWYTAPSGTAGNTVSFTQAMTLSSTTNRGTLDINGASQSLVSLSTGGTRRGYLYYDGNDTILMNESTTGVITFGTNSAERARINASGNLGVGTTSPDFKLDVINNATYQLRLATGDDQNYVSGGLYLGASGTSDPYYYGYMRWDQSDICLKIGSQHGNSTGGILFLTGQGSGAQTERARITAAGNFGIGTTSPSYRLDLGSGSGAVGLSQVDQHHRIVTSSHVVGTEYHYGAGTVYGYNYANATGYNINAVANVPLLFYTNNTERARITSGGDFYLGYTSGGSTGGGGIVKANALNCKRGLNSALGDNVINFFWTGNVEVWIDFTNVGNITLSSDYRIKKNVVTQTENALARIAKLRPIVYEFADYGTLFKADGVRREGFIAHEVQEVIPSGAEGYKDEENRVQSLRADAILAVVVKAIQELKAELDALKGLN